MADADVLVLGGGLSGLAAALELQRQGARVLVLEAGERLGGKAGSTPSAAGALPDGPTSFNGRAAVFWRFLELLGLQDDAVKLHASSAARYLVRDGRLRGLKPNPLSLLTTRALTPGEKWAVIAEYLARASAAEPRSDESMQTLLERRFGRSCVEHVFAAVFTGVFAGDLRKLSARSCVPSLAAAEREYGGVLRGVLAGARQREHGARPGLFTFRSGFEVIGARAAERLPHECGTRVERLEVHARGVAATNDTGRVYRAERAVLAVEADVASRLLSPSLPAAAEVLAGFDYAPLALLQWAERTPGEAKLPRGFGYLAAPVEQLFALGTLFVSDLLDESPRRFSTFVGGALQPERAALPDEALVQGAQADLTKLTGGRLGEVLRVVRWPRAVFQPHVGHHAQLERLHAALTGRPLALAGSYLGGAAMKDALLSGFRAAEASGASRLAEAA